MVLQAGRVESKLAAFLFDFNVVPRDTQFSTQLHILKPLPKSQKSTRDHHLEKDSVRGFKTEKSHSKQAKKGEDKK